MSVLSAYEPQNVLHYFEELCAIPHGSGNERQISDYLADFAKQRGLRYRQDEAMNVIIWKDGTPGYENSAPVIIQGHMDMVAVKTAECNKNMETDGLDLEVLEGDLISAKGTSLGGDDGIAVAYALALLDSNDIPHPPVEAVFTTNEEVGLLGAAAIDASELKGRMLINCDSEDEGVFTVSCAGGVRATGSIPFTVVELQGTLVAVGLEGLKGGHSGVEINKGRLNANLVIGRLLHALKGKKFNLVNLSGGEKDNAIPRFADAMILVDEEDVEEITDTLADEMETIMDEYATVETDMELTIEETPNQTVICMDEASTKKLVTLLINYPNGIQRMNPDMEDMVQTSLNLGIMETMETHVEFSSALRSSSESEKHFLLDRIVALVEMAGGTVATHGDYPGWEYRPESKLRDTMVEAFIELYGQAPVVEGIHAGLECGLFASKLENLDAISFGPDMQNIHTTEEVLSIASTARTWELLKTTLKKLQ